MVILVIILCNIVFININKSWAATQTFSYTGGQQTWTVPAGNSTVTIDLIGAAGGTGGTAWGISGGKGGRVQTTLTVTAGSTLNIYIGGKGCDATLTTASGGYNGGGGTGASSNDNKTPGCGGGASDIRIGGTALSDRVVVAGGGGGASGWCPTPGGNGGGTTGGVVTEAGSYSGTSGCKPTGNGTDKQLYWYQVDSKGAAGTSSAGGVCGKIVSASCRTYNSKVNTDGSLGSGGRGVGYSHGGGGGGGGYYGGGGGAVSGGGGGSSYTDGSLNASVTHTQGYSSATGNGSLTITYSDAPSMAITASQVSDGGTSNDSTLSLTFTSSEATSNFAVGDISVSGGSISNFSASSSTVYTATFTPSGDGAKTIDVNAATYTNSSSVSNTAATQFNWTYDGTAPTVSHVTSTSSDGTYKAADNVNVTVTFSEAVTVSGTPQITLETGTTDRTVNYASGSGSTALVFTYTVQANDTSSDLDYKATTSLALNGGTIRDAVGNNATLTLASPGATNSISDNQAIVIDGQAPVITITSTEVSDGATSTHPSLSLSFTASEATSNFAVGDISVSGGSLSSFSAVSSTVYTATFTPSGSGATTIDVNANTFTDSAGNNNSASTQFNWTYVADTTAPTLSSTTPADDASNISPINNIVLTFDESVDAESGNIVIYKSGGTVVETIGVTDSAVSGSGTATITINPVSDLPYNTDLYILIDSSAFDDIAGNSYAGISSASTFNFKTEQNVVFTSVVKTLNTQISAMSVNMIIKSIKMVSHRLAFTRFNNKNISEQKISFDFDVNDTEVNKMLNTLSLNFGNMEGEIFEDVAIWTRGKISYGKIGQNENLLGQDIHSDGLTIGMDKKLSNNSLVGIAFNRIWQKTEIGSNDASINTDVYNIMGYGSKKLKKDTYLDIMLGVGTLDVDLWRKVTGGQNTGNRKGQQLFSSLTFTTKPNQMFVDKVKNTANKNIEDKNKKDKINNIYSPSQIYFYSRLDLGYTFLDSYKESGVNTVNYNNQHILNATAAVGSTINKTYEYNSGIYQPFIQFEVGVNRTNNSLTEAYYTSSPATISTHSVKDHATLHTRFALGLDTELFNNWNINTVYDYVDESDDSYIYSLTFNLKKKF
ncbi:Ig-like domain-containing protein [Alphaproteobacteria bacterium]|nr:Ig-like domain-containing protein [Alphaproteobacteria bacterium]